MPVFEYKALNEAGKAVQGLREADSPKTLRATLRAWDRGIVAGGASVYLDGRLPFSARLMLPPFRLLLRATGLAAGCYVFCTRAAFEAAGGFPEDVFAGEELFFSRALWRQGRFRVLREPVISSGRATLTGRFAARIRNGSVTALDSPPAAFPRLLLSNFVPTMAEPTAAPGVHDARAARPPPHRRAAQ